ncbi:MAG TPA: hypothetical protein PLX02_14670 [Syntrophorhabdaceae bacterium]|nr:hypothetical protein [Syntrophorhabdaceae bacterium]HQM82850.1 hypothetical protein [Syntrophorhabdaceae bacterium]
MTIECKEFLRDGIFGEVLDNTDRHIEDAPAISNLLALDVNDYVPKENEEWDIERYEEREGHIFSPATRGLWKIAYRMARVLAREGKVIIRETGEIINLPSNITLSRRAT